MFAMAGYYRASFTTSEFPTSIFPAVFSFRIYIVNLLSYLCLSPFSFVFIDECLLSCNSGTNLSNTFGCPCCVVYLLKFTHLDDVYNLVKEKGKTSFWHR